MPSSANFFRGRKVLITGHTGFKGSWLTLWLHRLGAEITGISLPAITEPNLFSRANIERLCEHHVCDIRDSAALTFLVQKAKPEIIFHLAAQPLVRASYLQPLDTFSTNIMGAANLLQALREVDTVKSVVMVTTDKVYHNNECLHPYNEDARLGGHDPYSASKAASELVIASFRQAFLAERGVALATARAGNVIGGGDWSEDRLIPDAVRAWQNKKPLEIRLPEAIRPWQHVLEPLFGYMQLAKKLYLQPGLAGAYNFGPNANEAVTVREVIDIARNVYGAGEVNYHQENNGLHEAGVLMLDTSKITNLLQNHPVWPLNQTIQRTFDWYRDENQGKTAFDLCTTDIEAYEALL
ncbi:CDP-glucose 4,6-dehydratase [Paraglaciecola sp. 20A4]|uniref:CDP-glucose 4,6-dehydratase n=1 Tax=Paraglaciecola sp. 20A4 TaxID=2687288 RepID=UPI001408ABFA|nr:CDP-glucose 4,6-dehydratase [Paraglaciecola sp. 20A4]